MRRRPLITAALFALGLLAPPGCAGPGANVFEAWPELRPGQTTWKAVRARQAVPEIEAGGGGGAPATLADLIDRLVARSPEISAAWEAWRSKVAAVAPAGLPPNPEVAFTWLPDAPAGMPVTDQSFGVRQMIPSPVMLVAKHRMAVAMAEEAQHEYEARVLAAITELKSLLAEVRYLQGALAIVQANEGLTTELSSAAGERFGGGTGTLYDVSKARAQLAQVRYDRIRFEELLQVKVARLNALLDQPPGYPVPALAEWPAAPVPEAVEPLFERALATDPRVRAVDAAISARISGVTAARGRLVPDLMVGVELMRMRPAVGSGMDPDTEPTVGVMLGLSVPLWVGGELGRIDTAEADLANAVHKKRAQVNALLADVEAAFAELKNARRLQALYDESLLPEARRTLADAEAWYRGGTMFTDFLEAQSTVYQFALTRERAAADAVQAEARLERLLGGPLLRRAP